jgi:hypothetical protein
MAANLATALGAMDAHATVLTPFRLEKRAPSYRPVWHNRSLSRPRPVRQEAAAPSGGAVVQARVTVPRRAAAVVWPEAGGSSTGQPPRSNRYCGSSEAMPICTVVGVNTQRRRWAVPVPRAGDEALG